MPSQPCPCPFPALDQAPLQTAPPSALARPGPVSAAPAGGEGQSLQQQQQLGLWVIAGFLTFLALEKMFLDSRKEGSGQVGLRAGLGSPSFCLGAVGGGDQLLWEGLGTGDVCLPWL